MHYPQRYSPRELCANELVCVAAALLLICAGAHYCVTLRSLDRAERTLAEARSSVEALQIETEKLTRDLDEGYDDAELEKLARERLGLVMPQETVFIFAEKESIIDKEG